MALALQPSACNATTAARRSLRSGIYRQIPVDFFIRIAKVLNLTTAEQDALVRAWAFGVDRWTWSQSNEARQRRPAKRRAG
jgi:hypothetical protein